MYDKSKNIKDVDGRSFEGSIIVQLKSIFHLISIELTCIVKCYDDYHIQWLKIVLKFRQVKEQGPSNTPNDVGTGLHINQLIFWTFRNTENMVMKISTEIQDNSNETIAM